MLKPDYVTFTEQHSNTAQYTASCDIYGIYSMEPQKDIMEYSYAIIMQSRYVKWNSNLWNNTHLIILIFIVHIPCPSGDKINNH